MANEDRLISANKLMDAINFEYDLNYGEILTDPRRFADMVEDAPTVDAVEVPPVKIGDTAYFIIHRKIYKAEVYFIRWEHHKQYGIHSEISASVGQYSVVGASFDDFGKTLFLTEEEAKAALAKMDGEQK